MNKQVLLRIDGEVESPAQLGFADLAAVDESHQVSGVMRGDKLLGDGVTLRGLLERVQAKPSARYLGLHSSADNFHASIPLEPVLARATLVYRIDGQPLDPKGGGPLRFFIPDHAACHTDEIDECANVKFVDHIELTAAKGFDNRPQDDEEHEKLHQQQ